MSLRFGTDGWRAPIAEEFTFSNVRRVCAAIERAFADRGAPADGPVVIGYDTRFLSRRFAEQAAATFMAAGRRVILATEPCPTPATSCQVVASSAPFGVVITASHNPARFSGIKIKDASGASAGEEITRACEERLVNEDPETLDGTEGRRRGLLTEASFAGAHEERLLRMVDLPSIRSAGLRLICDPMHGACGNLLERLVGAEGSSVRTIHLEQDPLFGGRHPEPLEQNLEELRETVVREGADAGFATDGDGDRIGAFDEKGRFVSPLRIAPLLAWSLIRKGRRGPLGKTFANTILLDRVARRFGLPFTVFPVGFKHIAGEMKNGKMLLGGEESGGIGIEGFLPERDGTMVSLMLLQAMADAGAPLSAMVAELTSTFGELHYRRVDLPCSPEAGRRLVQRLRTATPASLGTMKVTGVDDLDGLKLLFGDEGWILFRASGTEPVLRVYSEVPEPRLLDAVMQEALDLVESIS